jgi:hypothetical protein
VIRPRSSTALIEASPSWRGPISADADTSVVITDVGLPAQPYASMFAPLSAYGAEFVKYVEEPVVPTRTVTCRYSTEADWLIVVSPTLRLTTEMVHPEVLNIGRIESLWNSCSTTFRIVELTAAAQPFDMPPGILNSTDAYLGISPVVEAKLAELFAQARHSWFEDGVESEFSRAFSTLIHLYGDTAVSAVETFLSSPVTNVEVTIEAAHSLGEVEHPPSLRYRRSLLERLLLSTHSVRLRHGAAAGLASLDDPSSLPVVSEAHARERNQRLRQFLQLVVEQLERTRACLSS